MQPKTLEELIGKFSIVENLQDQIIDQLTDTYNKLNTTELTKVTYTNAIKPEENTLNTTIKQLKYVFAHLPDYTNRCKELTSRMGSLKARVDKLNLVVQ